MAPSDAELASQALGGSQEAYRALVARYASAAISVAARLVHDRALAEDLAQDAFVRAFARLKTYDPTRRFSAWFFQVLHNVVVDHLRRRRINTVSLDGLQADGRPLDPPAGDAALSPEVELERRALAGALAEALQQIRVEYREAIILRYQQDLSVREIADVLQLPEGTVKTYLHRGRGALASILSAAGWKA